MKRWLMLVIILVSGCVPQVIETSTESDTMEKIELQTDDGITIVSNYWKGSSTAVLLLHMMPATKESWNEFATLLNEAGMSVLAIDLQGHGESVKEGLDYGQFTDEQHQASSKDVEAAIAYLKQQGATTIHIAGASIGANLALQYQATHPEIKKSILLSAGLNYRGIQTEPLAQQLQQDQQVFLAAGNQDGSGESRSDVMANNIAANIKGKKEVRVYDTSAHGTTLFKIDPNLMQELVDWLQ